MDKFLTICERVIPLDLDNVDTDMIIPASHLKSTSKDGYGESLFSNLKALYPDFILNNDAYKNNKILISKRNFGCGSSREHAVWSLQQYCVKAVICSSFSDIFYNNAAKNGLLLIKLDDEVIEQFIQLSLQDSNLKMAINLEKQELIFNSKVYGFEYDSFRKHCLISGLDDLDYLLSQNMEIDAYEKANSLITR
jgi:3-isopropylmalate/(R)-2-methylmalate dehydratase small subunit